MKLPTYEVYAGESLPALGLFVRENAQLVTGLDSGHTFALRVVAADDGDLAFTKTTGINGQAGSGFVPSGTPNIVIQWAAADELDKLTKGTYLAQLAVTRASDNRVRYLQFWIEVRAVI